MIGLSAGLVADGDTLMALGSNWINWKSWLARQPAE
jgi:hypothetical protein